MERKKLKTRKIYYYVEEEEYNRKRLSYLIILLLFTAVLLSTTTYAWFTTNRVVSVNELNVKVQAEGSLEISADGTDWRTMVGREELVAVHSSTYPSSVNQLPTYLKPVSTGGNLSGNGFLQMFLGLVSSDNDGNYVLTATSSVENEGNGDNSDGSFVAFDLFLKTTEDKDLYLTNNSQVVYNGNSTGTENAVRVAFVVEGTVASGASIATIQSLATSDSNNVYIWEPNYDTHTATGVNNAKDVYGISTSQTGAAQIAYDGVISDISSGVALGSAKANVYSNYFKSVTPKIYTPKGNTAYQNLFTLNAGITKVRVYMWLEGQDVDCENNASVGNLNFELQFSTNPS